MVPRVLSIEHRAEPPAALELYLGGFTGMGSIHKIG